MEMLLCGDDAVRPMLCGMSEPKNAGEVIVLLQQAEALARDAAAGRRAGDALRVCAPSTTSRACAAACSSTRAPPRPRRGSAPVSPVFVEESKCDERLCCDEPSRLLELSASAAAAPAAAAPGDARGARAAASAACRRVELPRRAPHGRARRRARVLRDRRAARAHRAALPVFGLVIARCEGWQFALGFMYIAGNDGLGEPLVDRSPSRAPAASSTCCLVLDPHLRGRGRRRDRGDARHRGLQDALPLEGAAARPCCSSSCRAACVAALAIAYVLATLEDRSVAVALCHMVSAMCGLGNRSRGAARERGRAVRRDRVRVAADGHRRGPSSAPPARSRSSRRAPLPEAAVAAPTGYARACPRPIRTLLLLDFSSPIFRLAARRRR